MNKNYYEILGVDPDISPEELKKVYHNLAQQWHPDKWSAKSEEERKFAEEKFKEISAAYRGILEEKKSKFESANVNKKDIEGTETTADADSTEFKKEKEWIEEELKRINEWFENYNLRRTISYEILDKLKELNSQGISTQELVGLWTPYRDLFEKLWSDSLNREEVINFKNQIFAAVEEAIKKAKEKKEEKDNSKQNEKDGGWNFRCYACGKTEADICWLSSSNLGGIHSDKKFCSEKCFNPFSDKWCKEQESKKTLNNNETSYQSQDKPDPLSKQEVEDFKDQFQKLQNQLSQLQVQIQSLLDSQSQNSADQSNQIQQIQEQLNSLQNQIQNLEKQPTDTPNAPVSQADKQELTKLKSQARQLQKKLQDKNQQSREEKNQEPNNIQQPPQKEFPWLWIVIPMGITIAGLLFLLFKKSKLL